MPAGGGAGLFFKDEDGLAANRTYKCPKTIDGRQLGGRWKAGGVPAAEGGGLDEDEDEDYFSIRIRMMIRKDGQLRNNLILILPLHPSGSLFSVIW